jgi:hypothetical protein
VAAMSRGLLSSDQVAEIEFLFSLLLAARIVGFLIFPQKFAGKYSKQNPPPDALRILCPPQIRGLLYAVAPLVGILFIVWAAVQYGILLDYIAPSVFLLILIPTPRCCMRSSI